MNASKSARRKNSVRFARGVFIHRPPFDCAGTRARIPPRTNASHESAHFASGSRPESRRPREVDMLKSGRFRTGFPVPESPRIQVHVATLSPMRRLSEQLFADARRFQYCSSAPTLPANLAADRGLKTHRISILCQPIWHRRHAFGSSFSIFANAS